MIIATKTMPKTKKEGLQGKIVLTAFRPTAYSVPMRNIRLNPGRSGVDTEMFRNVRFCVLDVLSAASQIAANLAVRAYYAVLFVVTPLGVKAINSDGCQRELRR
jgi:hypothetical protein